LDLEEGPKARQGPTRIVFGSGRSRLFASQRKKRQLKEAGGIISFLIEKKEYF
jgi:hypothetical protein